MGEVYHDFAKLGKRKVAYKEAFEDSAEIGSKKADWEKRRKKVDWEKHMGEAFQVCAGRKKVACK